MATMSQTPKSSMSQVRPEPYRPSMDDDESPLIHPLNEHEHEAKPFFKTTFSIVNTIRFITIPLGIADCRYVADSDPRGGLPGFYTFWVVAMMTWNTYQIVGSFVRDVNQKGHFQLSIGPFTCWYKRPGDEQNPTPPKKWNYLINLVDLVFFALMIVLTVMAFKSDWTWGWDIKDKVCGFSTTLASLQFTIMFLGLFSRFRKVKICVYSGENEDEKATYRIPGLYRDDPERAISRTPTIVSI